MKRIVSLIKNIKNKDEKGELLSTTVEFSQAPNRVSKWSESQLERSLAMSGPRFKQMDFSGQVIFFKVTNSQILLLL